MRYEIPEENMETLRSKLRKIEKKCSKFGNTFRFEEIGEIFKEEDDPFSEFKNKVFHKYIIVDVEGTAIVKNWEFLATLEHLENGNIVRTYSDGIKIPEYYRTCKQYCDHCHSNRRRKDTYLIRNTDNGEIKQVGRNCLQNYTCGLSAEHVAAILLYVREAQEATECSGCHFDEYISVPMMIKLAICIIDKYGFMSKSHYRDLLEEGAYAPDTTSIRIMMYLGRNNKYYSKDEFDCLDSALKSDETEKKSSDIVEWLNSKESDSNYIQNLKTLCSNKFCHYRDTGLIASLPAAYYREVAEELGKKSGATSEYVGNVGDKITLTKATAIWVTAYTSDYGTINIFKFVKDGNIFIWKTGKAIDVNDDHTCSLRGTIKAHSEFRNEKQTELTRCKIIN